MQPCRSPKKKTKKSRGFLLCLFPACTLPQVLCQLETYCSGATVLTQAVPANVAAPERNTPSSNEQKNRTPVWFATCGSADAWYPEFIEPDGVTAPAKL